MNCKISVYLAYAMAIYTLASIFYMIRTRTVGTPTLNTKYTFSFWVKRSKLTYSDAFMVDGRVDANNRFKIAFQVASIQKCLYGISELETCLY